MTTSGLPFDDIRNLAAQLPAVDTASAARVRAILSSRGGTLGQLEDIAAWFAAATGRFPPRVVKPAVALFAATHGVSTRLGIGDPVGEARARVEEIASGAAPVSHLCASGNLGLNIFDLALEMPVGDITREPALDERGCAATVAFGMEAVASGADLICLGTADSVSDPAAKALLAALVGRGSNTWQMSGQGLQTVIAMALKAHAGHLRDPLEALRRLGGREIAALVGAILAARTQKVAVILGGVAPTAAAAVLHALNPRALDHCLLASTVDQTHRAVAEAIGMRPLMELRAHGQDGAAAAVAAGIVRAAGDAAVGMADVRART